MKKEILPFVVGLGLMIAGAPAIAATIFEDAFTRANNNSVGNSWSEIENGSSDVAINSNALQLRDFRSGTITVNNPDAAASRSLSTVGFNAIQLSFDWKPLNTNSESSDILWGAYNIGSGWVNLGSGFALGSDSGAWTSSIFNLAAGASNLPSLGIRFWTNVSANDEGAFVDNVRVLGAAVSPAPEPEIYAMMLAGLGLMGFVARRRKLHA